MISLKHLVALSLLVTSSVLCNNEKKPRPRTSWECNEWCHTELGCIDDEAPWGLQWVANGQLGKKCQCTFDPAFLEYLTSRDINRHSSIIQMLKKRGTRKVKILLDAWGIPVTYDCESTAQSLIEEEHKHHIPEWRPRTSRECNEWCHKELGCIDDEAPWGLQWVANGQLEKKCVCQFDPAFLKYLTSQYIDITRSSIEQTLREGATRKVQQWLYEWMIPVTHDCESTAHSLMEEEHKHHIPDNSVKLDKTRVQERIQDKEELKFSFYMNGVLLGPKELQAVRSTISH